MRMVVTVEQPTDPVVVVLAVAVMLDKKPQGNDGGTGAGTPEYGSGGGGGAGGAGANGSSSAQTRKWLLEGAGTPNTFRDPTTSGQVEAVASTLLVMEEPGGTGGGGGGGGENAPYCWCWWIWWII